MCRVRCEWAEVESCTNARARAHARAYKLVHLCMSFYELMHLCAILLLPLCSSDSTVGPQWRARNRGSVSDFPHKKYAFSSFTWLFILFSGFPNFSLSFWAFLAFRSFQKKLFLFSGFRHIFQFSGFPWLKNCISAFRHRCFFRFSTGAFWIFREFFKAFPAVHQKYIQYIQVGQEFVPWSTVSLTNIFVK